MKSKVIQATTTVTLNGYLTTLVCEDGSAWLRHVPGELECIVPSDGGRVGLLERQLEEYQNAFDRIRKVLGPAGASAKRKPGDLATFFEVMARGGR